MDNKCYICGSYFVEKGSEICADCKHDDMYTAPPVSDRGPMIIAVDFDGTLCEDKFPEIGEPNELLIRWLRNAKSRGHKLILWTCRINNMLDAAVYWCDYHKIEFDAINDNLPENVSKYGTNPRKIFADVYIDDASIRGIFGTRDITWVEKRYERVKK